MFTKDSFRPHNSATEPAFAIESLSGQAFQMLAAKKWKSKG